MTTQNMYTFKWRAPDCGWDKTMQALFQHLPKALSSRLWAHEAEKICQDYKMEIDTINGVIK